MTWQCVALHAMIAFCLRLVGFPMVCGVMILTAKSNAACPKDLKCKCDVMVASQGSHQEAASIHRAATCPCLCKALVNTYASVCMYMCVHVCECVCVCVCDCVCMRTSILSLPACAYTYIRVCTLVLLVLIQETATYVSSKSQLPILKKCFRIIFILTSLLKQSRRPMISYNVYTRTLDICLELLLCLQ